MPTGDGLIRKEGGPSKQRFRDQQLKALGQTIRTVREARGFSQEDFAAHVGLARTYYGEVERGERNIAALNLIKIALSLDIEVGILFPSLGSLRHLRDSPESD